jgi:hypothetical protein
MIRGWLRSRREAAARVAGDADALMARFGADAYAEARRRVIEQLRRRPADLHWSRVRPEIARRLGRVHVDTATRYLDRQ